MTPAVVPRFLTLPDVATYLNVSERQVYALVRSGDLPAIKIGRRGVWRVDRQRLESWIESLHEQTNEWTRCHPRVEDAPNPLRGPRQPRPLPTDCEVLTTVRPRS